MPVSGNGTAYDLAGPDGAPAVVLIHGLGLTREVTWGHIAPVLARRYRVLSYDLPGHGQTAAPDEAVSLRMLGRQLVALMDELGLDRAALAGFSLGGMINRRVAMDDPGRVSALAILNSPHEREEEQQKLVEQRARDTGAGGPAATIDTTLARWFTERFRHDHPETVQQVRDTVLANETGCYAAHRQVLAEGVTELIRPDPPITKPALVMTCQNDSGSTPAMSWAIAKEIGEADVVIVPELQHLGLIERPDLFSAPLEDFLGRVLDRN
ncbi:alpha/beta fold hydrolase [Roseovarius salis]|uniref:alpha/beta fold hydrolase n=1 Tax=Roseovarius salis TaxID=3376063 RepID=UPI0037C673EC